MVLSIIISMAIAFAVTFFAAPYFMKFFRFIGLVCIDQNKGTIRPIFPTSHGVVILIGCMSGLLAYVAIATFVTKNTIDTTAIFAAMLTIMILTIVGFTDDITSRSGEALDKTSGDRMLRRGIRQRHKALMVLPAAIPLMVIDAGMSSMVLPFIGTIQFGLIYPIILIPLAILCIPNAYNMLAGLNGLEAGMGTVALASLGIFAYLNNSTDAAVIGLTGAMACIAILKYAWCPTRFLPGDSTTYLIGGLFATTVIVGNIETFGAIIFLPWIIEAFNKAAHGFKGTCHGKLTKEGYLKPKNDKIESLTHIVMSKGNFTESQVVLIFIAIEALLCAFAFGLWYINII